MKRAAHQPITQRAAEDPQMLEAMVLRLAHRHGAQRYAMLTHRIIQPVKVDGEFLTVALPDGTEVVQDYPLLLVEWDDRTPGEYDGTITHGDGTTEHVAFTVDDAGSVTKHNR